MSEYVLQNPCRGFSYDHKKLLPFITQKTTGYNLRTYIKLVSGALMILAMATRYNLIFYKEIVKMRSCVNGDSKIKGYDIDHYVDECMMPNADDFLKLNKENVKTSAKDLAKLNAYAQKLHDGMIGDRIFIVSNILDLSLKMFYSCIDKLDEINMVAQDIVAVVKYRMNGGDEALDNEIISLTKEIMSDRAAC